MIKNNILKISGHIILFLIFFLHFGTVNALIANPVFSDNVLFIPGLEGSRLYEQRTILGVSLGEDQLWEPTTFLDIPALYLNLNGKSINTIYTKDIIGTGTAFGLFHSDIYQSLIDNLNTLTSSGKIFAWKAYAYDWRQGINDLIQNGTKYNDDQTISLISTLQSLVDTSNTGNVTIIAHSNGGLLAKALIKKLEDMKTSGQSDLIDHVDTLILVASPQVGAPWAFSGLLHGYGQSMGGGVLINNVQARDLAENMPSAYGLLPSEKYFEQIGIGPLAVFASTSAQIYQTAYGLDIDSYQKEHSFILGEEGRTQPIESDLASPIVGNSGLLTEAVDLHNSIDNMTFPEGMNVIDIAGWGKETVSGMTYTNNDVQPIFTLDGDERVVSQSALYGQGTKYWLDISSSTLSHADMFEDSQLLNFIDSIVVKQPLVFGVITDTKPFQIGDRLHVSVHSPVSIGVYDNQGNFTGKVCDDVTGNCTIQEKIPGSSYFEFGEGKYVNLGKENLQKITLQGTDTSTFTFDSQVVTPSGQTTTSSFVDIPVTPQTQAQITLNQTTNTPQLALDVTGDGVTDFTLVPNTTFDPITYLQVIKATIDSLDVTQAKINAFDKRIDTIIKSIQKGKIDKAKLKADKFETVLQNKLAKPDLKKPKPKKLSKADAQALLDMLNGLLDNIG